MASLNKVVFIGNITKDLELKQTKDGISVCSFDIAVNRKLNREVVDFIPVETWRKQAEFVAKYFKKGSNIVVCGELQTTSYTDKQGNKRTGFKVVADEVTFGGEAKAEKKEESKMPYIPTAYTASKTEFEAIDSGDEGLPF